MAPASARSARFILGRSPFSSQRFACRETPIRVPILSKRSTNSRVRTAIQTALQWRNGYHQSASRKIGATDAGAAMMESGTGVTGFPPSYRKSPIPAITRTERRIAPGTRKRVSRKIKAVPARARSIDTIGQVDGEVKRRAKNDGAGSAKRPRFFNPITMMKSPIPAWMAILRESGMAWITCLRNPVRERTMNRIPVQKTIASAPCQGTPRLPQMVKVKKAFSPIPGASAIG